MDNDKLKRVIGLVLRNLRESHNQSVSKEERLTQSDIADFAGLSTRYYNYLENGQKMPTIETLIKIAEAYKMPLSELCKHIENY